MSTDIEPWDYTPEPCGWSTEKAVKVALSAGSTLQEMAAAAVVLAHAMRGKK